MPERTVNNPEGWAVGDAAYFVVPWVMGRVVRFECTVVEVLDDTAVALVSGTGFWKNDGPPEPVALSLLRRPD